MRQRVVSLPHEQLGALVVRRLLPPLGRCDADACEGHPGRQPPVRGRFEHAVNHALLIRKGLVGKAAAQRIDGRAGDPAVAATAIATARPAIAFRLPDGAIQCTTPAIKGLRLSDYGSGSSSTIAIVTSVRNRCGEPVHRAECAAALAFARPPAVTVLQGVKQYGALLKADEAIKMFQDYGTAAIKYSWIEEDFFA